MKNKNIEEVDNLLKDLGTKIDALIEKGKKVSGEAGDEIDKKINEFKANKEDIENQFRERKTEFEQRYHQKRNSLDPRLKQSSQHFKEAFFQLNEAIKVLFSKA